MADRDVAAQAAQLLLVEDLRHEPEVAQRREPALVGDRDPGRLLTAVLEREEPEVREPRDVAVRCVDAEDAAHRYATSPIWTKPFDPSRAMFSGATARIAAPRAGSSGSATSAGSPPLQRAASSSACSSPP